MSVVGWLVVQLQVQLTLSEMVRRSFVLDAVALRESNRSRWMSRIYSRRRVDKDSSCILWR